jgi:hypothetical protein
MIGITFSSYSIVKDWNNLPFDYVVAAEGYSNFLTME